MKKKKKNEYLEQKPRKKVFVLNGESSLWQGKPSHPRRMEALN